MFQFSTEQKVCEIGGVKFGGQPGEYPCVCCSSIFQKGDRVFEGKRKEGIYKISLQPIEPMLTGFAAWKGCSPA